MKQLIAIFIIVVAVSSIYAQEKPENKLNGKSESKPAEDGAVDVSGIENQYWVAKDSDFKVVQNRIYKKEKRVSLTLAYGPLINDQFSTANGLYVSANYHFSERWGLGIDFLSLPTEDNELTKDFIERFGVVPNHNKIRRYMGVSGQWVPIYAKASIIDKKIIYYDLALSAGLGVVNYEQQFTDKSDESVTTPALSLDIVQKFFLTNHWALYFSYMLKWHQEEVLDSRSPFAEQKKSISTTNLLLIGGTYFF